MIARVLKAVTLSAGNPIAQEYEPAPPSAGRALPPRPIDARHRRVPDEPDRNPG
jgi:hypothetical protein